MTNSRRPASWRTFQWAIHTFQTKSEYQPISTKDQARLRQFGKKVLSGFFLRVSTLYVRRGSWKGDELYFRRIKTKEVLVSTKGDNFIFRFINGSVKLARKRSEVGPSHPSREDIGEGEEEHRSDLQGATDKPDSAEQQQGQDELEAKYVF